MKFNINDNVRVKLTDAGRKVHKQNHLTLFGALAEEFEYRPPKEDADGWYETQLWCVMKDFGHAIYMGGNPPFETTIEIVEKASP